MKTQEQIGLVIVRDCGARLVIERDIGITREQYGCSKPCLKGSS